MRCFVFITSLGAVEGNRRITARSEKVERIVERFAAKLESSAAQATRTVLATARPRRRCVCNAASHAARPEAVGSGDQIF